VDSTHLQILPLSLIMVMGPQILTAIFLVTSHEPVKNSGAMLTGVLLAASLSILIWFGLYEAVGGPEHRRLRGGGFVGAGRHPHLPRPP
jgi:hypothetical protein